MEEAINEFVINNLGLSVFIMVLILVAVPSLSIWFYKIHEKVNSIDKLPCEKHMDMITRHERSMTKVETSISFLIKEIESLARMLNNNKGFTKTMSPLSITEEGYKMINRLGLDKMFSRNWRRIDDLITSDCEEKTAYERLSGFFGGLAPGVAAEEAAEGEPSQMMVGKGTEKKVLVHAKSSLVKNFHEMMVHLLEREFAVCILGKLFIVKFF